LGMIDGIEFATVVWWSSIRFDTSLIL
jgi:hypothetical protein